MIENEFKGSLLLPNETIIALRQLTGELKIKLLDSIIDYHCFGILPEEDGIVSVFFSVFRQSYDKDQENYREKCERNRKNQLKRWEKVQNALKVIEPAASVQP